VVKNPPVLILDEPCQGLDDYYRKYFLELIDQLCVHTPLTLVYISHYASEIPSAIDHTLRLKHGEVFTSP
jgi:molybdate transport system ATP-binding protein